MSAVRDIIAKWETPAEFGRAIGLSRYNHAHLMKLRMSIPMQHWPRVIEAAKAAKIDGVTSETLLRAHAEDAQLRADLASKRRKHIRIARASVSSQVQSA